MSDWSITQGARLRELRMKKGFSVSYIANKIDCGEASIYRWELGQCAPRHKFLHDMAFLYNVSVEEILTGVTGVTDNNDMTDVTDATSSKPTFKPVPIDFTKPFTLGGTPTAQQTSEKTPVIELKGADGGTQPIVEFRADGMVFGTKFDKKTQDLLGIMATLTGKTENEVFDIAVREYAQYVFDWNKALDGFCNE